MNISPSPTSKSSMRKRTESRKKLLSTTRTKKNLIKPSREDSLDRLLELGIDFFDKTINICESVTKNNARTGSVKAR